MSSFDSLYGSVETDVSRLERAVMTGDVGDGQAALLDMQPKMAQLIGAWAQASQAAQPVQQSLAVATTLKDQVSNELKANDDTVALHHQNQLLQGNVKVSTDRLSIFAIVAGTVLLNVLVLVLLRGLGMPQFVRFLVSILILVVGGVAAYLARSGAHSL
jgi:hypothetical protein